MNELCKKRIFFRNQEYQVKKQGQITLPESFQQKTSQLGLNHLLKKSTMLHSKMDLERSEEHV